jgi:hypothetical protein
LEHAHPRTFSNAFLSTQSSLDLIVKDWTTLSQRLRFSLQHLRREDYGNLRIREPGHLCEGARLEGWLSRLRALAAFRDSTRPNGSAARLLRSHLINV